MPGQGGNRQGDSMGLARGWLLGREGLFYVSLQIRKSAESGLRGLWGATLFKTTMVVREDLLLRHPN